MSNRGPDSPLHRNSLPPPDWLGLKKICNMSIWLLFSEKIPHKLLSWFAWKKDPQFIIIRPLSHHNHISSGWCWCYYKQMLVECCFARKGKYYEACIFAEKPFYYFPKLFLTNAELFVFSKVNTCHSSSHGWPLYTCSSFLGAAEVSHAPVLIFIT